MLKKTTKRPQGAKNHATSTRTDAEAASHKKRKATAPSVATAFELTGRSISKLARDAGDTAQRLAKSARVFSHTVHTQMGHPDKNLIQTIEDGFADAAKAFSPTPDFSLLADEAEEYLDTLRHAAKTDPKLKPIVREMEAHYQGILAAGIANAVWDYHHDPESKPTAQRQAMDFADAFYREVPTEDSLEGLFATYAAVNRNVARIRQVVTRNTETIHGHVSNEAIAASQSLIEAANSGLSIAGISLPQPKTVAEGLASIFQIEDQSHIFAKAQNAILEPQLIATEARITALVRNTHAKSSFYREAHLGLAHVHMGSPKIGVRHLEEARQIFNDKGEVTPAAEDLATQIGILHRIAENSPEDPQRARDRLAEADNEISLLAKRKGMRDPAILLHVDNLLLKLPHRLQEQDDFLARHPDEVDRYHLGVALEHQRIISYCTRVESDDKTVMGTVHGQGMLQATIQFEKGLDAAMSLQLTGEPEKAEQALTEAKSSFIKNKWAFENTAHPALMQEAMGRMHWSNATYTFKMGDVEQSLRDLRTLTETYGTTSAAQILRDGPDDIWVHKYGIVDQNGNLSPDIDKPSEVAKWKKIADKLLDDKASLTKTMMAGAGVAVVGTAAADFFLGSHIIGAEVLGGLTLGKIGMIGAGAGLITERGYQVLAAQREISAAYKTGIANVTTEELAERGKTLAGEIAVCFIAGGAARYVRMGIMGLGAKLRAPLLQGLLSEASMVVEGVAFHEYSGMIHGTADHSAMGYFRSFLTLRLLGAGGELNLGSLIFPGEAWADAVMRHGFNTAVANIPLQAFESAIARDLSGFGHGYFDALFGLYAITVGGKVPEAIMHSPQILARAKAMHLESRAKKLFTQADTLANTISVLQSHHDYAETPNEKANVTQKLADALQAHAKVYQKLADMGLFPTDKANAYANGVEKFSQVAKDDMQQLKSVTPSKAKAIAQRIATKIKTAAATAKQAWNNRVPAPGLLMMMPIARRQPDGSHTFTTGIPGMPDLPLHGPDMTMEARLQTSSTRHDLRHTWIQTHYANQPENRQYAVILEVASAYRTWAQQAENRTRQALDQYESGTLPPEAMVQLGNQLRAEESVYSDIFRDVDRVEGIDSKDDRKVFSSRTRSSIAQHTNALLGLFMLVEMDINGHLPPDFENYRGMLNSSNTKTEIDGYPPGIHVPYHNHELARGVITWLNTGGTLRIQDGRYIWEGSNKDSVTTSTSNELNGRPWPPDPIHDRLLASHLKFLGWEMHVEDGGRVVLTTRPSTPDRDITRVVLKHSPRVEAPEVQEAAQSPQPTPPPRKPQIPAFVLPTRPPPKPVEGRVQVELALPERRAQVQDLNLRLITEGDHDAFAAARAENHFDSKMIFFSPYSPALFYVDAKVDPSSGAIQSLGVRNTKNITAPSLTTIDTSIAVFSPWGSSQLTELHSEAMRRGLHDHDPVPKWVLTEIGKIVEARAVMSFEGMRIQTQFAKWFSFVNSTSLTIGDVFSNRVMEVHGDRLPTEIAAELQRALEGKPFQTQNAHTVQKLPNTAAPDLVFKEPQGPSNTHRMNAIGGALLAMGGGGEQLMRDFVNANPIIAGGVALAGVVVSTLASRLYNRHVAAKQRATELATQPPANPDEIYLASISAAEAEALRAIPRDQWLDGRYGTIATHQNIRDMAKRLDVVVDPVMLAYFAKSRMFWKMENLRNKLIGSTDEREALQAATHQYQLVRELFGATPTDNTLNKPGEKRHLPINDQYEIAIYKGFGESSCGIEIKLIDRDNGKAYATVGFQETDNAIEVVRYQGGVISQSMRGNFTKFSGGTDPMPWLSYVAGKLLLQRAQATGKELRWTAGERVRATYPHIPNADYKGKTIEEARAYWSTPNPELDEMLTEYDDKVKKRNALSRQLSTLQKTIGSTTPIADQERQLDDINDELGLYADLNLQYQEALMWRRGTRTQQNYDTAAHNLGFEHHHGSPWNRLIDFAKFGRGIGDSAPEKQKFNESTQTAANALSVLLPFSAKAEEDVRLPDLSPPLAPPKTATEIQATNRERLNAVRMQQLPIFAHGLLVDAKTGEIVGDRKPEASVRHVMVDILNIHELMALGLMQRIHKRLVGEGYITKDNVILKPNAQLPSWVSGMAFSEGRGPVAALFIATKKGPIQQAIAQGMSEELAQKVAVVTVKDFFTSRVRDVTPPRGSDMPEAARRHLNELVGVSVGESLLVEKGKQGQGVKPTQIKLPGLPPELPTGTLETYSGAPWVEQLVRDAAAWVRDTIFTRDLDAQPHDGTAPYVRSWRAMNETLNDMTARITALEAEIHRSQNQQDLNEIRDELDQVVAAHTQLVDQMVAMKAEADAASPTSLIALIRHRFADFAKSRAPTFQSAANRLRTQIDARLATALLADTPDPDMLPRSTLNPLVDWLRETLGEKAKIDPDTIAKDPHLEIQKALAKLTRGTATPPQVVNTLDYLYEKPGAYPTIAAAWALLRAGGQMPTAEATRALIADSSRGFARITVVLGFDQDNIPITAVLPVAHHGRELEMGAASEARDPELRAWVRRNLDHAKSGSQTAMLLALRRGIDRLAKETLDTLKTASNLDALTRLRDRFEALSVIYTEIATHTENEAIAGALRQRITETQFSRILQLITEKMVRTPAGGDTINPVILQAISNHWLNADLMPATPSVADIAAHPAMAAAALTKQLQSDLTAAHMNRYSPESLDAMQPLLAAILTLPDTPLVAFMRDIIRTNVKNSDRLRQALQGIDARHGTSYTTMLEHALSADSGTVRKPRVLKSAAASDLPGLPPKLPPGKVETYSGAPWMRDAGKQLVKGAIKAWEWLREDPDVAFNAERRAALERKSETMPEDPVEAVFNEPTLTDPQRAEKLRAVFYNDHPTEGDLFSTSAVLTFFGFVQKGTLNEDDIRNGARDVALALMKRPDYEHGPFVPNTFGSYMHNFLGLSPRDFNRSGSEQVKVWTQEAHDGFSRRAQEFSKASTPTTPEHKSMNMLGGALALANMGTSSSSTIIGLELVALAAMGAMTYARAPGRRPTEAVPAKADAWDPQKISALYGTGTSGFDADHIEDTINTIHEIATQHHIPLTTKEVLRLVDEMHFLAGTVDKTKGAIDMPMALWSWVNRRRLLGSLGLPTDKNISGDKDPDRYAQVKIPNTPFTIAIQEGWFESDVGFDVALYVGNARHKNMMATIGFQYSKQGIEIVKYQGGARGRHDDPEKTLQQFRSFSGNVDPLPWVAHLVGKLLLSRAQQEGGQLRWLAGQQVAEAENYNEGEEVKRIQRLYDTTAQNLGFRRKGPNNPWYRYTKDPAEFGSAIRNGRMSDPTKFEASVGATETAIRVNDIFGKLVASERKFDVHYSGVPFIEDLARQAAAGLRNLFGIGKTTDKALAVTPSDKPAAAALPYVPSHWKDLLPGKMDIGDPIWLHHIDAALAGTGSYQNAYRHMMRNAFATRWDDRGNPSQFNFETDPWTNSRFVTALRGVRQRMAAELARSGFIGIDTADLKTSLTTFNTLGEFDAFVVTELQRIREIEEAPKPPVATASGPDDRQVRAIDMDQILPLRGAVAPTLHIEGSSIPREFKEGDRVEIGRDGSNNDISFPSDDLVSRAHALIVFERSGEFVGRVTDLSSSNGTKVIRDGVSKTLRDGERFNLKLGDIVQVGTHRIYVGEPPPRSKPSEDPNEIAPTNVIPLRFREGEAQWRPEFHPRNRNTDYIWRVRKNDEDGRARLMSVFQQSAHIPNRWPINFVVQAKPGTPDDSLVLVGHRFWPGQKVPEAGVKHIQIANGEYAQWAGELRGIFDAHGQLVEVQFNANSGEFGRQSLNASQDDDIRIVRTLLAKVLHLNPTQIRFVR